MHLERVITNKVEAVNSSFGQVLGAVTSPETSTPKCRGTAVGRLRVVSSCAKGWESHLSFPGATEHTKKHYLTPRFHPPP